MKSHLLGRQGEIEGLEIQLSESKAEAQNIEDKYADLASEMQELQQQLASEVELFTPPGWSDNAEYTCDGSQVTVIKDEVKCKSNEMQTALVMNSASLNDYSS